jgi:superfamily II DNA or RNA helicase
MSLRPRQIKAVADVTAAYRAGFKAPILIAPTGFGKTHTSADIIRRALARGRRVWFLAHLDEILSATARKLQSEGIPYGWIAAGRAGDRKQPVQVVSVFTLARRLNRYEPPDFLIVDEAHLAVANTYQVIFEWAGAGPQHWRKGGAHLLHLTATPQRLDGRGMGEVADVLVPTCSTGDLIGEGLLAPIRYFEPTTTGPDGKPAIVGEPLEHYRKHAHGRPAIAFCTSNEHARENAELFSRAGYRTVAISGDSDPGLRDAAMLGIQTGQLDLVFNCKLWVAGVDVPAVSCILDLSPTESLVRYLQGLGRGLRTHPGKDDLIYLDCVGNRTRHGDPAAGRLWTLEGADKGSGRVESEVPAKTCPKCFSTVHAAATHCHCGHQFMPGAGRVVQQIDGELREVAAGEAPPPAQQRQEQGRTKTLEDLIALGRKRGHKRPELWARHVYQARLAKEAQSGARN